MQQRYYFAWGRQSRKTELSRPLVGPWRDRVFVVIQHSVFILEVAPMRVNGL
jgi:hypothetical protein